MCVLTLQYVNPLSCERGSIVGSNLGEVNNELTFIYLVIYNCMHKNTLIVCTVVTILRNLHVKYMTLL